MAALHVETPLLSSTPLAAHCGGRCVLLKMESAQPAGSFKIRGIGALCQHHVAAAAAAAGLSLRCWT